MHDVTRMSSSRRKRGCMVKRGKFVNEKLTGTDKMSDSDLSFSAAEPSSPFSEVLDGLEENVTAPYELEPLAAGNEVHVSDHSGQDCDHDGLKPDDLAKRHDKTVPLNEWCKCGACSDQHLEGALEYRCCKELNPVLGKMSFEGCQLPCITLHEDYLAMTNQAVLQQVGPLLRDSQNQSYRRRTGQTENEHLRAVAYRWIVRWLCGYLGWSNRRPLSACIYHNIRQRYTPNVRRGYKSEE